MDEKTTIQREMLAHDGCTSLRQCVELGGINELVTEMGSRRAALALVEEFSWQEGQQEVQR